MQLTARIFPLILASSALAIAQAPPRPFTVVGTWRFVRIDSPGPDGKPSAAPQPTGMLIYTQDGHASVQLMYPLTSLSNEFVHEGYEATFGTYEVNELTHKLTYHRRRIGNS